LSADRIDLPDLVELFWIWRTGWMVGIRKDPWGGLRG
jgi:hypothetical protein